MGASAVSGVAAASWVTPVRGVEVVVPCVLVCVKLDSWEVVTEYIAWSGLSGLVLILLGKAVVSAICGADVSDVHHVWHSF